MNIFDEIIAEEKKERSVSVYTDATHRETITIKVLNYRERENLKKDYNLPGHEERTHLAHYHRYIELFGDRVGPSFEEYVQWKKDFPGWSCGHLTSTHSAWKPEYRLIDKPMNQY